MSYSVEKLQVGVVGVGYMGANHARVYSELDDCLLAGVFDVSSTDGERVASQFDTEYFDDLANLLGQVDAVSLAVPTPLHHSLALEILNAEKHILIEKPVAVTSGQAKQIQDLALKNALVVHVGHIERFNPAFIELQRLLEELTTYVINFYRLSPYRGSNLDVDVVLDLMIHDLDLAGHILSAEPVIKNAFGTAPNGQLDHVIANLLIDETLATITASRIYEGKVRNIEVITEHSTILCNLLSKKIEIYHGTSGAYERTSYRQEGNVEVIQPTIVEPLRLELETFVTSIIENDLVGGVSIHDGIAALELAELVRAKAQGFN